MGWEHSFGRPPPNNGAKKLFEAIRGVDFVKVAIVLLDPLSIRDIGIDRWSRKAALFEPGPEMFYSQIALQSDRFG